jgi:high potential iron-sulfur protein
MSRFSISRRRAISLALGGVVLAPFLPARRARATQNAQLRAALKYQEAPMQGQQCSTCAQFIPGKTPKDRGGCKIMPGDTEISPQGWCTAWTAAPPKK